MTSWEAWDANGYHENAQSPIQQAEDLFCTFVSGGSIESDRSPHVMRSPKEGVWELSTAVLRFFGWFWKNEVFTISTVDQPGNSKEFSLYAGYRQQCVKDRRGVRFDKPSFVKGESKNEAL